MLLEERVTAEEFELEGKILLAAKLFELRPSVGMSMSSLGPDGVESETSYAIAIRP